MSRSLILITLVVLTLFSGLSLLIGYADLEAFFETFEFSADASDPLRGPFGFLLLSSLLISLSCPRQVVAFFAAYFFGLWSGVFLALVAMTASCVLIFFTGAIFKERLQKYVKGKIKLGVAFWEENAFLATLIWRFVPAGSNWLTNLAAGALGIPAMRFIAGSAIGYIPHTIIFALLGSGIEIGSEYQLVVSGVLFAIACLLGWWLYKKYRHQLYSSNA